MTDTVQGVSPELDPRSRKTLAIIARRVADVGLEPIANKLHVDVSTVSRMSAQYERLALLLTAIGLKVVPVNAKCYVDEHARSLEYFARRGMDSPADEIDTGIFFERGK